MLNKEYIKEMLKDEEYDKIHEYMYYNYSDILYNFIKSKEQNFQKSTLNKQIRHIYFSYPEYEALMENLMDILQNEEDTLIERLNSMIDYYKILVEQLK